MASQMETVLQALESALTGELPTDSALLRNSVLPERIPAGGLVIIRDGDPGEPERWMSPPGWYWEHTAELEVVVDGDDAADRDERFDVLRIAIATALAADRTLGGVVDYCEPGAPAPVVMPVDGDEGLKAATIPVLLAYATTDPLA